MGLLVWSLLVVLFQTVACVKFNTTYEADCLAGCDFNNATLWEGGVLPTNTDNVLLAFSTSNQTGFVYTTQPVTVLMLSIQNTTLQVRGAVLSAIDLIVEDAGALYVSAGGVVAVSLLVEIDGTLNLADTSKFYSPALTSAAMFWVTGTFVLLDSSKFQWGQGSCVFDGVFNASAGSEIFCKNSSFENVPVLNILTTFESSDCYISTETIFTGGLLTDFLSVEANGSVRIYGQFFGQVYVHEDADFTLKFVSKANINSINYPNSPPIGGLGSVFISDSTVNITGISNEAFNGTLYVIGQTNLQVQHFTLVNLNMGFQMDNPNAITITGNDFTLAGNTDISNISFVPVGEQGISFLGEVTMRKGDITVSGSPLSVMSLSLENSKLLLGGNITAQKIFLDADAVLTTTAPSVIQGDLENNGRVEVSPSTQLLINGNYAQTGVGCLSAILIKNLGPSISISGNFTAAGSLEYTLNDQPYEKSISYLVATMNNNSFTGNFGTQANSRSGSTITRQLNIEYQYAAGKILVDYSFDVRDLAKWIWGVLGAAVAVLIVIIIAVVVRCRNKRRHYEPV